MSAEEILSPIDDATIGNKELLEGMPSDTGIEQTLEYLVRRLRATKKTEEDVKARRILCEEKIAALIPGPERGQKTVALPDGTKVTVERGFLYQCDVKAIEEAFASASLSNAPVKMKTTISLDETGYEYYRTNDPVGWNLLQGLVQVTPKKVSVSLRAAK